MKRRGENMQLRADEVEALNDESDEEYEGGGTFQRADEAVLAQRRRVKIRRPGAPLEPAAGAPTFTSVPASNPFSGFAGLSGATAAPSTTASSSAAAAAAPPSNPFAGFTGLAPAKPASLGDTSAAKPSLSFMSSASLSTASLPSAKTTTTAPAAAPGSSAAKMETLNRALHEWVKSQMKDHALSIWKDGLMDYIKYANEISEASEKEIVSSDNGASSSKAVTSSTASGGFSFSVPSKTAESTSSAPVSTEPPKLPAFSFSSAPISAAVSTKEAPKTGFSFGSLSTAPAPVAPAASSEAPKTSFSFSMPSAPASSGATPAPSSAGFSFSLPSTGAPFGGAPFGGAAAPSFAFAKPAAAAGDGGGDEDGEGGDDEAAPILEPEKVFRNENDTDQVLHEAACKLFRFNKSSNEWNESGKGTFKVTQDADTKKRRMLIRNMTGKVTMNAAFYSGMKFSQVGKNGIRFMAVVDESGEPKMLMIKVKPEEVAKTQKVLEDSAAAVV